MPFHTPTAPDDYISVSTELTIPAGDIDISFPVTCNIDDINDSNESFTATLSDPSGASLGLDTATIQIVDANGMHNTIILASYRCCVESLRTGQEYSIIHGNFSDVSVSFDQSTYDVEEGNVVFLRVVLNILSTSDITVMLDTSDGTAEGMAIIISDVPRISSFTLTAPGDYTSVSTQLTIPAGELEVSSPVTCNSDDIDDPDEIFSATLSNPSGAFSGVIPTTTLGLDTATIQIVDANGVHNTIILAVWSHYINRTGQEYSNYSW